jgi:hypothetical protein
MVETRWYTPPTERVCVLQLLEVGLGLHLEHVEPGHLVLLQLHLGRHYPVLSPGHGKHHEHIEVGGGQVEYHCHAHHQGSEELDMAGIKGLGLAAVDGHLGEHPIGGVDGDHDLQLSKAAQPPTDSSFTLRRLLLLHLTKLLRMLKKIKTSHWRIRTCWLNFAAQHTWLYEQHKEFSQASQGILTFINSKLSINFPNVFNLFSFCAAGRFSKDLNLLQCQPHGCTWTLTSLNLAV